MELKEEKSRQSLEGGSQGVKSGGNHHQGAAIELTNNSQVALTFHWTGRGTNGWGLRGRVYEVEGEWVESRGGVYGGTTIKMLSLSWPMSTVKSC